MAKGFHVITAHSRKDEPTNIDYTLFGDSEETGVFLMGLSHVEEVAKGLMDAGVQKEALARAGSAAGGHTGGPEPGAGPEAWPAADGF